MSEPSGKDIVSGVVDSLKALDGMACVNVNEPTADDYSRLLHKQFADKLIIDEQAAEIERHKELLRVQCNHSQDLKLENEKLKAEKREYGDDCVYMHRCDAEQIERLQAENEKLKAALEKCKGMRNDPPNPWDFDGDDYAKELARQNSVLDDILRGNE